MLYPAVELVKLSKLTNKNLFAKRSQILPAQMIMKQLMPGRNLEERLHLQWLVDKSYRSGYRYSRRIDIKRN
jgi:hypothetical protein